MYMYYFEFAGLKMRNFRRQKLFVPGNILRTSNDNGACRVHEDRISNFYFDLRSPFGYDLFYIRCTGGCFACAHTGRTRGRHKTKSRDEGGAQSVRTGAHQVKDIWLICIVTGLMQNRVLRLVARRNAHNFKHLVIVTKKSIMTVCCDELEPFLQPSHAPKPTFA